MIREPVWVWGLPLAPMTRQEAVQAVADLVAARRPSFFITANLHYAMLSADRPDLRAVNDRAAFVLADGAPLVWASRRRPTPIPERVAGSDLIYDLCRDAARRGHRVYLLGGGAGIAVEAARRLVERFPGLVIAGTACPDPGSLAGEAGRTLVAAVRATHPDLLMVAFGQPKGEFWIAEHLDALEVPACVQVGATLDFVAGRVKRAPRWMQRTGLEWFYRMSLEPSRLFPRYFANGMFLIRALARGGRRGRDRDRPPAAGASRAVSAGTPAAGRSS